jgi:membrane protein implicated in regulation of membrane protease activity
MIFELTTNDLWLAVLMFMVYSVLLVTVTAAFVAQAAQRESK